MAEKLLQEVMEEIRLTEKKLGKALPQFENYSIITHVDRPTIGYPDKDKTKKFDPNLAEEKMKSELQSYRDLVRRLAILKRTRDEANIVTKLPIKWDDQDITIYDAIQLKRSIAIHMRNLYNRIEKCKCEVEAKSGNTYSLRLTAGKSQDKGDIELINLLPIKQLEEESKKFDEMMSNIEAKITIANSTTKVDVPECATKATE